MKVLILGIVSAVSSAALASQSVPLSDRQLDSLTAGAVASATATLNGTTIAVTAPPGGSTRLVTSTGFAYVYATKTTTGVRSGAGAGTTTNTAAPQ